MSRVTDRKDWRNIWEEDKLSIIKTMRANLASDITAGNYDLLGLTVQKQITDIEEYERGVLRQQKELDKMDEKTANKWCYYDLKKRGVIC
jgi:hypothetical protein